MYYYILLLKIHTIDICPKAATTSMVDPYMCSLTIECVLLL